TPEARCPTRESAVGLPSLSRYMSRFAAAGAFSRKSSAYALPLTRATRNPPPPTLPADGMTTASAKAVAIAASTALPPAASISCPALVASAASLEIIPRLLGLCAARAGKGHPSGKLGGAAETGGDDAGGGAGDVATNAGGAALELGASCCAAGVAAQLR